MKDQVTKRRATLQFIISNYLERFFKSLLMKIMSLAELEFTNK